MAKVKITKIKSVIKRPQTQKLTMLALGLRKMNATVEHELTPQLQGQINKVKHLIHVEELK